MSGQHSPSPQTTRLPSRSPSASTLTNESIPKSPRASFFRVTGSIGRLGDERVQNRNLHPPNTARHAIGHGSRKSVGAPLRTPTNLSRSQTPSQTEIAQSEGSSVATDDTTQICTEDTFYDIPAEDFAQDGSFYEPLNAQLDDLQPSEALDQSRDTTFGDIRDASSLDHEQSLQPVRIFAAQSVHPDLSEEKPKRGRGRPKGAKTRPELASLKAEERANRLLHGDAGLSPSFRVLEQRLRKRTGALHPKEKNYSAISAILTEDGHLPSELRPKRSYVRRKPLEEYTFKRKYQSAVKEVDQEGNDMAHRTILWAPVVLSEDSGPPLYPQVHSYVGKRQHAVDADGQSVGGNAADLEGRPSAGRRTIKDNWLMTLSSRRADFPHRTIYPHPTRQNYESLIREQWKARCNNARPKRASISADHDQPARQTCRRLDVRNLWIHVVQKHTRQEPHGGLKAVYATTRGDATSDGVRAPVLLKRNIRWSAHVLKESPSILSARDHFHENDQGRSECGGSTSL